MDFEPVRRACIENAVMQLRGIGGVMRGLLRALALLVAVSTASGAQARDDIFHIWPIEQACLKSFTDFAAYAGCVQAGMLEGRPGPLPAERFFIGYLNAVAELSRSKYFDVETQRILYQFGRTVWQADKPGGRERDNPRRTVAIFFLVHALTTSQNRLPLFMQALDDGLFYQSLDKTLSKDEIKRLRAVDEKCFPISPFFPDIAQCLKAGLLPPGAENWTPQNQFFADYMDAVSELSSIGIFNRESVGVLYLGARVFWIQYGGFSAKKRGKPGETVMRDPWDLIMAFSMMDWAAGRNKLPPFRPSADTLKLMEELSKSNAMDFVTIHATCASGARPAFAYDWSLIPPSAKGVANPTTGSAVLVCTDGQLPTTPPSGVPYSIRVPLVPQTSAPALAR